MTFPMLFLCHVLAAYRATRLITTDSLFEAQREAVFNRWPPNADRGRVRWTVVAGYPTWVNRAANQGRKPSKIGQLIECPWCIGFWVSGLVVGVVATWWSVPMPFLVWPAVASAVGLVHVMDR